MEEGAGRQKDCRGKVESVGEHIPVALAIAGSDCSGGAGIQADLKTFAAHGVYGESVIVSVVAENTCHVVSAQDIDPQVIGDQIDAAFEDMQVDAVKVGMLATQACMEAVVAGIERWKPQYVVLDPVMESTSGTPLMDLGASEYFEEQVLPMATIVTPNIPEAERLANIAIESEKDQIKAAHIISERAGGAAVLVKGGHRFEPSMNDDEKMPDFEKQCDIRSNKEETCGSDIASVDAADVSLPPIAGTSVDILWDGSHMLSFVAPRFETTNTHGTGCTLSSAIAANLALGKTLVEAIKDAKQYVTGAIAHGLALGHGHGPTNHFHYLYLHGLNQEGPLPDDLPAIRCTELPL